MTQLGADVQALDQIAERLGGTATNTDAIRSALARMADELQFYGRYGDQFCDYLRGPAALALGQASGALRQLATVAQAHAAAQRDVSDGKGLPTYTAPHIGQRTAPTEVGAVGAMTGRIERDTPAFSGLVRNDNADIVFKDEEKTGADRLMTPELRTRLDQLATAVRKEWPDLKLRVTEAWDEDGEHAKKSLHYEGRAADLTLSDVDSAKLPRLYELARDAGFGWVYYENSAHVHVSVSKPAPTPPKAP
jgi:hypothetical protein